MKSHYANRGKPFESLIIASNKQYAIKRWAVVEKVEAPFKALGMNNSYVFGFYESKGFVDFVGIANGRSICFEAKSTRERTSFPLDNIKRHQVEVLRDWHNLGGISFVLIEFEKRNAVYLLRYPQLQKWWKSAEGGGRKSIPFQWFHFHCPRVRSDRGISLDYLKALKLP